MKPALPGVGGVAIVGTASKAFGDRHGFLCRAVVGASRNRPNRYQWLDTLIAPISNRRGDG
jgi:hypothetical protein